MKIEELVAMIKDTNEKVSELHAAMPRVASKRDPETGKVTITDEDLANAPDKVFGAPAVPAPPAPAASEPVAPAVPAPPAPAASEPVAPAVPAPPVPAASEPVASAVPAPPAPAASDELDAKGMPWDSRIHAGSKAKNKDGTWRQRRNLAAGLVEQVEAEHKGAAALPADAPTFLTLIERVQQLIGAARISPDSYRSICANHGFSDPSLIAAQPEKIPAILTDVEAAACQ